MGGLIDATPVRLVAHVDGQVQGVGFRVFVRRTATALGLTGAAQNLQDGRVKVTAEGPRPACEQLIGALQGEQAPGAVRSVHHYWTDAEGLLGFVIG